MSNKQQNAVNWMDATAEAEGLPTYTDLAIQLKLAAERVKIANAEGDRILSAWLPDVSDMLARLPK